MRSGVVVGLVTAALTCLVTEIYCHRAVAHRAFRVHPVLASILEVFMQVAGGMDPASWAGIHRLHHRYADTPLDPHSPLERRPLSVLFGTWYLIAVARRGLPADASPGTARLPLILRTSVFAFWFLTIGLVPTLTALVVHLVCYLGVMGMVNTVGHRAGSKPHPDVPGYDLAWMAILLLGHGYHNSHHAHPAAARTGLLDPIWPILRVLARTGLITLDGQRAQTSRACCTASASVGRPAVEVGSRQHAIVDAAGEIGPGGLVATEQKCRYTRQICSLVERLLLRRRRSTGWRTPDPSLRLLAGAAITRPLTTARRRRGWRDPGWRGPGRG